MKLVIVCCTISCLAALGSAFSISEILFSFVGSSAQFQLYRKDFGDEPLATLKADENVIEDNMEAFMSYFDSDKETKILIHGWRNNHKKAFAFNIRNAYQNERDYNVIVVDWSPEANSSYLEATMSVPKIASVVASLIDVVVLNYNGSLDKMHLIGHSLGAHVAGLAGMDIKSPGKIARITGLDPAHPLFTLTTAQRMKQSAEFVDVIHTCGNFLSFMAPLGHADFYPNGGGFFQPGCSFRDLRMGSCSHNRAHFYFAESIKSPKSFVATQCDTYELFKSASCTDNEKVFMGESVSTTARGKYFLKTNNAPPYGLGDDS